ncbi:uncharacterized protein LOC141717493 isoform X3 [Apium graveolens]|uniref:uncharacterized protein LOC141717493 isoform X3 n=1 Tax=Apium graveolens TaxID=4045 RepID=UPI003D79B05B
MATSSSSTPANEPNMHRAKVNRQPVKLTSSLKKISDFNLSCEKKELFKNSKLASLASIKNNKESSAALVETISSFYSLSENKIFINEKVFSFCPKEVADVLGITVNDTDIDFDVFREETKCISAKYPEALYKLRKDVLNIGREQKMTPDNLKRLINDMSVEKEEHKILFVQLLNYYYIEQFALCYSNPKQPRPTLWRYVSDLEKFEKVNWAKAIHGHLMESISDLHKHICSVHCSGQHNFTGCAPVLETILFERMSSLGIKIKTFTSPPLQNYTSQRKTVESWRTSLLECEISQCDYCPSPSSPARSPLITRGPEVVEDHRSPRISPPTGRRSLLISPRHSPIESSNHGLEVVDHRFPPITPPPCPTKSRTRGPEEGLGQQQQEDGQRGALKDQQQENEGHEKEEQVENIGVEEVMLLDISSDEEETKPEFDHLSMLMPVSKSPSHIETSGENLEILMAAAVVLKDELVKHLVRTAHKLDTADMVRSANKCFIGLKSLKVDYGAFHGEVCKLIKLFQELKEVNEKNTCPDLDLKVAYDKSMSDVNAAREELANAGSNLIIAQTDYQSKLQRIEKLIAKTHRLKEEADKERIGIGNLETKRDHCDEVLLLSEKRKDQYENIQRSLNRLKGLV